MNVWSRSCMSAVTLVFRKVAWETSRHCWHTDIDFFPVYFNHNNNYSRNMYGNGCVKITPWTRIHSYISVSNICFCGMVLPNDSVLCLYCIFPILKKSHEKLKNYFVITLRHMCMTQSKSGYRNVHWVISFFMINMRCSYLSQYQIHYLIRLLHHPYSPNSCSTFTNLCKKAVVLKMCKKLLSIYLMR